DSDPSDPGDWSASGECGAGVPGSNSSWHGTHVAGTVGAVTNNAKGVAGTAFGAKIMPVRVLGRCGGYTSDIADAIVWASGGTVS
ncbi:S8 family serine peptidase, partial [Salmonella enterica]|uniref:S8 family serine peptidase n=1 Tax=Salmonella enterica TaxID=28901 RepID=UPI0020A605F5